MGSREPPTLEERALEQFDTLVSRGEILWTPNKPLLVTSYPFDIQFRVVKSWLHKPVLSAKSPSRSHSAFLDSDPNFHLLSLPSEASPTHRLILNKFSAVRPQFILHTAKYESQDEKLNERDLRASWDVLGMLGEENEGGEGKREYMCIFNCGIEGGSSQGHKHLQFLPVDYEDGFRLWPDDLGIDEDNSVVPVIPFKHAIQSLPPAASTKKLLSIYMSLLGKARVDESPAHNVILTKRWIVVIPRRKQKFGTLGVNAAGMIGMIWVAEENVMDGVVEEGVMEGLKSCGIAT